MHDYMKALQSRFYKSSEQIEKLKQESHTAHKRLSAQLDNANRRLLLELLDLEDELRSQSCLENFICGYKVADGIQRELLPQYDFEEDDNQRAKIMLRGEG